jgi:hypothetical protein
MRWDVAMHYRFRECLLDTRRYELWRKGERVKLRPKVFQVLVYLIRHRDRVVSKDELLEQLWPNQFIAWFTEGFATAALQEAEALLAEFGSLVVSCYRAAYPYCTPLHLCRGNSGNPCRGVTNEVCVATVRHGIHEWAWGAAGEGTHEVYRGAIDPRREVPCLIESRNVCGSQLCPPILV